MTLEAKRAINSPRKIVYADDQKKSFLAARSYVGVVVVRGFHVISGSCCCCRRNISSCVAFAFFFPFLTSNKHNFHEKFQQKCLHHQPTSCMWND